jgi:hypothetical protein
MSRILNFYMDDSGTRHPDRKPSPNHHGNDWFALGGVLIRDEDEDKARELHSNFCKQWNITYPLHSTDIRARRGQFRWLETPDGKLRNEFLASLDSLMISVPVVGIACVIDRPGYNARYREKFARERWSLCKTAFCVAVERAVKFAAADDRKLRVLPERCNNKDDSKLAEYYRMLRADGQPFANDSSAKYAPLGVEDFQTRLYDFKLKKKSSPMAQLADLYLWPMCVAGYDRKNRPYQLLTEHRKLVDTTLPPEQISALGIKYSCFGETAGQGEGRNNKGPDLSEPLCGHRDSG